MTDEQQSFNLVYCFTDIEQESFRKEIYMKFTKLVSSFAIGFLSLGLVQGVRAQNSGLGLVVVNVDRTNVVLLNDIANDLNVNVSDIPVTVQVPVGIAANVCNVAVNVLATPIGDGGPRTMYGREHIDSI